MDLEQEITEQEASINVNGGVKNVCSFCNATKTPLWRAGPSGPKSLCNACGIKYTKKMRAAAMGLEKAGRRTQMKKKRVGETLKVRLKELEREMVLQRSDRNKSQKLGEEERAALLLMALSYGYVYG